MGLLVGLQESVTDEVACGIAGERIRRAVGGTAHGDAGRALGVPISFRIDSEVLEFNVELVSSH